MQGRHQRHRGRSRDETGTTTDPDDSDNVGSESTVEVTDAGEASLEITNHDRYVCLVVALLDVFVEPIVENRGDVRAGNIELQADWYDKDGNSLNYDKLLFTNLIILQ